MNLQKPMYAYNHTYTDDKRQLDFYQSIFYNITQNKIFSSAY